MKTTHKMIRSIGTSLVALFLIAGAAFATTAVVGGSHRPTNVAPAAQNENEDASETPEATDAVETEDRTETDGVETAEAAETAEPAETDEVETAEPAETDEPAETPEATHKHHHSGNQRRRQVRAPGRRRRRGRQRPGRERGRRRQRPGRERGRHGTTTAVTAVATRTTAATTTAATPATTGRATTEAGRSRVIGIDDFRPAVGTGSMGDHEIGRRAGALARVLRGAPGSRTGGSFDGASLGHGRRHDDDVR